MSEQIAAPAHIDGSQLSGPFVHVAEQTTVNGLQVGEVEPALEGILRKFSGTGRHKVGFGLFEYGRVGDPETIFQDTGGRVKVIVMAGLSGHYGIGGKCCGSLRPSRSRPARRGACPQQWPSIPLGPQAPAVQSRGRRTACCAEPAAR